VDSVAPEVAGGLEGIELEGRHAADGAEVAVCFMLAADASPVLEEGADPVTVTVLLGDRQVPADPARSAVDRRCHVHRVLRGEEGAPPPEGGWDTEGVHQVSVTLSDPAGNRQGYAPGAVTVDFTPPTFEAQVQPGSASLEDVVTVTIDAHEPLADGFPGVEHRLLPHGRWTAFAEGEQHGLSYSFRRRVWDGLVSGTYAFRVSVRDLAGNEVLERRLDAGLEVDSDPPEILGDPDDPLDPTSPLVLPDRLHHSGDKLTLVFSVSEPLGEPPRVLLGAESLGEPAHVDAEALRYTFEHRVLGAPGDDALLRPLVHLVDRAGNEATDAAGNSGRLELGRVRFDFTPLELTTGEAVQREVNWRRNPWGSAATGYAPRMEVVVGDGFSEVPGEIRVWLVRDPAAPGEDPEGRQYRRSLLGSGDYEPGREIVIDAGAIDAPLVHLTVADPAGNETDVDPERDGAQAWPVAGVEWIATLGGWEAGNLGSNPHLLARAGPEAPGPPAADVDPVLLRDENEYAAATRLDDGSAVRLLSSQTGWQRHVDTTTRLPLGFHGLAYDPGRGRVIASYPGASGLVVTEFDGADWGPRDPVSTPPSRTSLALATDTHRQRVVMFGGAAPGPGACGVEETALCEDTWEWDGADWRQRAGGAGPCPRRDHALAYDAARRQVVLFGGETGRGVGCVECEEETCADTWGWDGREWHLHRPDHRPLPRLGHAMAYDAARERVVLFGGCDEWCIDELGDTWEWDGTDWREQDPGEAPVARHGARMAYDAVRQRVVLFGGWANEAGACGVDDSRLCADTWEWDGDQWLVRHPATSPMGRMYHAVAFDPMRGVVLLQGGCDDVADTGMCAGGYSDTWEWDGTSWRPVSGGATSPVARHALAPHPGLVAEPPAVLHLALGGWGLVAARRGGGSPGSLRSRRCLPRERPGAAPVRRLHVRVRRRRGLVPSG